MRDKAVKKAVVSYRTYLVANGKVRWVVTWDQVTRRGPTGNAVIKDGNFKGRATDKFDEELDKPRWDVGTPFEELPDRTKIFHPPVTLPNPLIRR